MRYDKTQKPIRMYELPFVLGMASDISIRMCYHSVIEVIDLYIIRCAIFSLTADSNCITSDLVSEFVFESYGNPEKLNYDEIAEASIKVFIIGSGGVRRIS